MTCREHCGGEVYFLFFFFCPPSLLGLEESRICQPTPMVSGADVPAVAFSSGGNAAGREGWQFSGSIRWLLSSSTFRAPCPLSGGVQLQVVDASRQALAL